jgi:hypothetical protein
MASRFEHASGQKKTRPEPGLEVLDTGLVSAGQLVQLSEVFGEQIVEGHP